MKKEFFAAIIIGFVLGLIITLGIWTANKSLKNLPKNGANPTPTITSPEVTPAPTSQPTTNGPQLTITSPEDDFLSAENSVTISGTTVGSAVVSITHETGETLLQADANGKFEAEISLESGYNQITVTAIDSKGQSTQKQLLVTYTTAKI
ncbi:MAG: hypothetical protein AAB909_00350 [Patescibacteria group bacterium]